MKWFYDMKIGARLITAFVIVGAITAIVGYMGINSMGNIAELAASSYANQTLGIAYIKQADVDLIVSVRSSHLDWKRVSNRCPLVSYRTPDEWA